MSAPVHALLIAAAGDLPVVRGVRLDGWDSIEVAVAGSDAERPATAVLERRAVPDTTPLLDADLLVLRGPFATAAVCTSCGVSSTDERVLLAHEAETRHAWRRPHQSMVRALASHLLDDPRRLLGRGLVLELGDDRLADDPEVAPDLRAPIELEFLRRLLVAADVVVAAGKEAAAAAVREGARNVACVAPGPAEADAREAAWLSAAETAGRGPYGALGLPADRLASLMAESRRRLEVRRGLRAADAAVAETLARLRSGGDVCWGPEALIEPLVSVIVPVDEASATAVDTTIASALATDGVAVEVLLVAEERRASTCAPTQMDARLLRVPVRLGPDLSTEARQARLLAAGLARAAGAWHMIAPPSSVLLPATIPALLEAVSEHGLEIAYGQSLLLREGEAAGTIGGWPPSPATAPLEATLFAGALRAAGPHPDAADDGEACGANLLRRWIGLASRVGSLDEVVAARTVEVVGGSMP